MYSRSYFGVPPEVDDGFAGGMQVSRQAPFDVAEILRSIKTELSRLWGDISVQGELRSFKVYPSGHIYFDLRDRKEDALISCVLFRRDAQRLTFRPKVGDLVELRGTLNIYEPRGQLNFIARQMKPAGAGDLFAQFLALKEKLAAEGLFAPERKKPLAAYPDVIGVVTSPEAAALRDVVRTLERNAPWVKVILYPTSVQGAAAEGEIVQALRLAAQRREVDVLLVVRGGGSIADLWSFNAESVARMLAQMPMPVISGVGHEVDFTIADFVADVRAATPTAAAAMAVEGWVHAAQRLAALKGKLALGINGVLDISRMRLSHADRLSFAYRMFLERSRARLAAVGDFKRFLTDYLDRLAQRVDGLQGQAGLLMHRRVAQLKAQLAMTQAQLAARRPDFAAARSEVGHVHASLVKAALTQIALRRERLLALDARLQALDMAQVLARGYSVATTVDGRVVREADELSADQKLELHFSRGTAGVRVESVQTAQKLQQTQKNQRD